MKLLRWGREDWGALLQRETCTIYSLQEENYSEVVPLHVFEAVLRAWKDFVQTPPDVNKTQTLAV